MTRLTRKDVKFDGDDRCEAAFQELKRRFTTAPIVDHYPIHGPARLAF